MACQEKITVATLRTCKESPIWVATRCHTLRPAGQVREGGVAARRAYYSSTPPTWYAGETLPSMPGWDTNLAWEWSAEYTGPSEPNSGPLGGFVAPIASNSTIYDRDAGGIILGTLDLTGTGYIEYNLELDQAIVDLVSGQILTPYRIVENYTATNGTGSYASIQQTSDWTLEGYGRTIRPIYPGQSLTDATSNPSTTASATFYITGNYAIVPEPTSGAWLMSGVFAVMHRRNRFRFTMKSTT
ncbi:MAG: hypothetical protein KDA99_02675 [Planctomycetales bacterium]|nr:hypothetical protein [Planctomycetales bacterium]